MKSVDESLRNICKVSSTKVRFDTQGKGKYEI
jgi:hypothetical protein